MRASELNIDLNKHILYSPEMEKVIREKLSKRYDSDGADKVWEKVQLQYAAFLKELPYLGGKKNTHNGVGGTYDCIMLFAYYEVLNPKPSVNELYEMNVTVFLPAFQKLAGVVNANKPLLQRLLHLAFVITAKKDNQSPEQSAGYIMEVEPYSKTEGVRYHFQRCPIAEFAKEHGYLDIMPAFCNTDYPAMDMINGALIRKHTCANSNICDYWIVGDKSDIAKKHPRKTDEKGYWYND
ncbi:MAG: L-2-amino-thiazoline-4-carboxylic acid hydrolase [Bacillus sp. (in: Bacteria)]|nr:L-2-amino-thiazoline-4-carboxylic acid hydrolase [Bacillus sp. (in: firmicutes)]MCM1427990.1 L-2-amino-thiazoline-4-carboxylic acid hydrolase [Eubacterium sp.]